MRINLWFLGWMLFLLTGATTIAGWDKGSILLYLIWGSISFGLSITPKKKKMEQELKTLKEDVP